MNVEARIASWVSDGRTTIVVRTRDSAVELAARLADDTPSAIRDRCYSLVQSMADYEFACDATAETILTWTNEAYRIAKDAGWVK